MVRAPCCEKMGVKQGAWMPEEDRILIDHIQRHGHGNWRALPKQAGLLRCGKSCRLRWTNYLRPDIKRGNFTKEEEDAIINLHQMLGNRWSVIASRLPGRTDNEIKNVWHTHIKKRLGPSPSAKGSERKPRARDHPSTVSAASPSCSDASSVGIVQINDHTDSLTDNSPDQIDESFGWDAPMSMEQSTTNYMADGSVPPAGSFTEARSTLSSVDDDDMSFWLRVFWEAGDLEALPEILTI